MGWEHIEWPGPRPLSARDVLVGRSQQVSDFVSACTSFSLVLLTARSGVGKSSFLKADGGVGSRLESLGFRVVNNVEWGTALSTFYQSISDQKAADERTDDFDRMCLLYGCALGIPVVDLVGSEPVDRLVHVFAEAADPSKPEGVVVVLDQFEELLRLRPQIGAQLLVAISDIAKALGAAHVVAARSEYKDHLRVAERGRFAPFSLPEISEKASIEEIIRRPIDDRGDVQASPQAVSRIAQWWIDARTEVSHPAAEDRLVLTPTPDIGLLHLQALLWNLRAWCSSNLPEGAILDDDALDRFSGSPGKPVVPIEVITSALREYINHIGRVYLGGDPEGLSASTGDESTRLARDGWQSFLSDAERRQWRAWPMGRRTMAARVARSFASGGYKVPQAFPSLAAIALRAELPERALQDLERRLDEGTDIGVVLDEWEHPLVSRERTVEFSPSGVASVARWSSSDIRNALIGNLKVALRVLADENVNVLRQWNTDDNPVYELVHDGMGTALAAWATDHSMDVASLLCRVTPVDASPIDFDLDADDLLQWHRQGTLDMSGDVSVELSETAPKPQGGGQVRGHLRLIGHRWIGSKAAGAGEHDRKIFKNVHFVDCNFLATVFEYCSFQSVVFTGCDLRGVAMLDGVFEDVQFVGCDLDTLTLLRPEGSFAFDGRVSDEATAIHTSGLFLRDVQGRSEIAFAGFDADHVSITVRPEAEVVLRVDVDSVFSYSDIEADDAFLQRVTGSIPAAGFAVRRLRSSEPANSV